MTKHTIKDFESYLDDDEVARRLNKALSLTGCAALTEKDIGDWVGDDSSAAGENYDKTDKAVRAYMGDEMYEAIAPTARLLGTLHARLQGIDECTIGGYGFKNLQSGLKGKGS